MSVNPATEFFGYHTTSTVTEKDQAKAICLNALNVAGYFPALGIGTCILRCLVIYKNPDDFTSLGKVVFIGRGVLEALGLGLMLLIPDLIVSIARHLCGKCQPEPVYYSRYSRHTSYEESYY